MENTQQPVAYHSGFISIIGRPNVGKSTLLNQLLGEKIAITTEKPQTTRNRILGIHHRDDGQIVYLDTPGIHKAKAGLNRYMLNTALGTISEADLVYFMVEAGPKFIDRPDLGLGNMHILNAIRDAAKPAFLIINKIDQVEKHRLLPFIDRVKNAHPFAGIHPISALTGDGVPELLAVSYDRMPEGPPYYPEDQITDRTLRFLASEFIREQILLLLREEVPYSVGVLVENFKELDRGKRLHIDAMVVVERKSQKGIVIGKQGTMLSKIGRQARESLESYFDKPVGLKLFVKVQPDWTTKPKQLSEMGYK